MKRTIFTFLPIASFCRGSRCMAITRARRPFIRFAFASALLLSFPTQKALSQGNHYEGPVGVTGIFNGNVTTGCSYDPLTHSEHREVTDIVVPGSIGKYPLKMTRYYNSRSQYYALNAIGLSPGWSHEYSWLLWAGAHKVVSPHGNVYDDSCGPPVSISEYWEENRGETWRLADGGRVHFNGGLAVAIEDPYGLTTTIEYQNGRRWRVTEPGGRCLIFIYGPAQDRDGTQMLTKVEAYDYYNGHRIDWVAYSYREYNPVDPLPQGRQPKMMLRSVSYTDGTSTTYDYTFDNVPENGTSHKMYPLLQRCDDARYSGPMRTIVYDYHNGGPHGAITAEKYPGVAVSSIQQDPGNQDSFIETRGDGVTRKFTYTHFTRCQGNECGCSDYDSNIPPQQVLTEYTDFQGHTTWLDYDRGNNNEKWYVNSVTDARGSDRRDPNYTTTYTRGPAPPNGIGEITQIKHPDTSTINYVYSDKGHYLTQITDERGNKTVYGRDANHRITGVWYQDNQNPGNTLAYEGFTYCDQTDSQCSNNPLGQVKRHQLKNGAYVHYRYDQRGLLIDKWEPTWNSTASDSEPKTHYDYYTSGPWTDRLKTNTLPANYPFAYQATETYEYDKNPAGGAVPGRGLVTKITHTAPENAYQSFAYDVYGNKLWEENELGKRTSYTYDDYNRVLAIKDPIGQTTGRKTSYTYNPTNGTGSSFKHTTNNPDTITTPTGIQTSNEYDENFRKTSATVGASTTWFHYDPVGNQDWATDPRGTAGRTYPNGDPAYTTYTDYDNRNRKSRVREPLGRTTQFYYDDKINVTRIIRPDQTTEIKAYDGMNRLITDTVPKEQGVNIVTQFQYYPWNVHSASLLWKVIDGENHNTTFEYDPSGSKTKMTYHDNSYQTWAYDDAHNLKSRTTVASETQNFGYDNRNRKIGEWWDGWPADGEWRAFGYDDASHLRLAANGTGNYWDNFIADVRRSYDDAGRLTQDQQKVYVNDVPITKNVNYPSHDDDGQLLRMYIDGANPAYDYTYSYDGMGRFEKIFATGQPNPFFQYHYDDASNETQRDSLFDGVLQIYPRDNLNRMQYVDLKKGGNTLGHEGYGYDTAGRLGSVTREDNKQDRFAYYKDGELNVATYGANPTPPPSPTPTPPGQVAPPTFNPDGVEYSACAYTYPFAVIIRSTTAQAQIRYTTDGSTPTPNHGTPLANGDQAQFTVGAGQTTTLRAIAYVGATASNVHGADYSFYRECGGLAPIAPASAYPLDNAGNLLMAPALGTTTYTLDNAGNRRSVNGQTYSPNTINQYTSAAGNPVTNGDEHEISDYYGFHYTYMRDQELIRVSGNGIRYDLAYDALGRCVKRTINNTTTTYYIYDGDKPILEYNGNNALVGFNVYGKGIDEIIERGAYGTDNQWHWYFLNQDHEGSVTHLTATNGTVIEKYRYDAFGVPTVYDGAGNVRQNGTIYNNRFLFTGREYAGAWMYEYRARMYHSGLGRFMSQDPKLFDAGDYNLFRYCHNDPIDFTDPMGLVAETTGLLQSGTNDRLWDITKWFDSSNTFQGTFQVWTVLQQMQLSIRSGVTAENYGSPASPFRITSRNISVDYDGTPGAYGGPGIKGVETLANAGPGDTTIAYRNGKPVLENGYYVSKTSFHRGNQTIQHNNINGSVYPYAALGSKQTFGARPGDIVRATNHLNGRGVWMVYGDYRGTRNSGLEFSPAALRGLEIPFHGNNVRLTPVTLVVYPGSASGEFP